MPAIFDFIESEGKQRESIVIVVSPLNALIRDQLQKLKGCVNVCVLQSTVEDEEQKVTVPKDVNKCSVLFGHSEVFVGNKTVVKMLKGEEFQRRVRAIVKLIWFCNGIYMFYFKSCFSVHFSSFLSLIKASE